MTTQTTKDRPLAVKTGPIADAGWPANAVERRSVIALEAYVRNARTHSPGQVAQIAASIRSLAGLSQS
jgi:hypothetical protein